MTQKIFEMPPAELGYSALFAQSAGETSAEWFTRSTREIHRRWSGGGRQLLDDMRRLAEAVAKADPLMRAEVDEWFRKQAVVAVEDMPSPLKNELMRSEVSNTPAIQAVKRWRDSDGLRNLVLRGGVGVGKSYAAAWWLADTARLRLDSFPDQAPFERGRLAWMRPDQFVSGVLHTYDKTARRPAFCFVLDDMGRETKPDFQEALSTALDGGEHTMVITTNLTKEQMRQRYDARLIDRMNSQCFAFDVPGKSMRKQDGGF